MGDLGVSDYLFIAFWACFACFARYRWVREQRAESRRLVRVVGDVVTLVLLAAPMLMIVGALTGRLDRTGS